MIKANKIGLNTTLILQSSVAKKATKYAREKIYFIPRSILFSRWEVNLKKYDEKNVYNNAMNTITEPANVDLLPSITLPTTGKLIP
jgi:hypothetical protein